MKKNFLLIMLALFLVGCSEKNNAKTSNNLSSSSITASDSSTSFNNTTTTSSSSIHESSSSNNETSNSSNSSTIIIPVSEVSINQGDDPIKLSSAIGSYSLSATVSPEDATNKNLLWTSSNTDVATVDMGELNIKSAGETTITVKSEENEQIEDSILIKISSVEVDSDGLYPFLNYEGDIDIMVCMPGYGGEKIFDIGNKNYNTTDLTDGTIQRYYSVAKIFNEFYPDISINLYMSDIGDYHDEVEKYRAEHNGHLPQLMQLPNGPIEGLSRGYNADIKKYNYFKLYNALNPAILDLFTVGDFVTAIPMYINPTGMFVNKKMLASNNYENYDNLLSNWTMDELVYNLLPAVHSPENHRAGTAVLSSDMINIVSETIDKTLLNEKRRVTLDTDEVKDLIDLEEEMYKYSLVNYDSIGISSIKSEYSSYVETWNFNTVFTQNNVYAVEMARSYCLTLYSNMIQKEGRVGEFDFMPFPKYGEDGENRVGLITEGLVVGNQCPLNSTCTQKDKDAEEIAAVFALFLATDTRAAKAMATTPWTYGLSNTESVVLQGNYETLPLIRKDVVYPYNETKTEQFGSSTLTDPGATKTDYDIQMAYYRQMTSAFERMEGFEEVLRIYEEEFDRNVFAYNSVPRTVPSETGSTEDIMMDWNKRFSAPEVQIGSTGWATFIKSKLSDWEVKINSNITTVYNFLQANVDMYYGKGKYDILNKK